MINLRPWFRPVFAYSAGAMKERKNGGSVIESGGAGTRGRRDKARTSNRERSEKGRYPIDYT